MSNNSRKEYRKAIQKRYRIADKNTKKMILDEFTEVCGYHRKYAIRVLNSPIHKRRKKKPGRPKQYRDPMLLKVLTDLWRIQNLPCSKRLHASLPDWLPHYEQAKNCTLSDHVKEQLLTISPATIDRLMVPMRAHYFKLGLSTTKPGSILKSHIPVKTGQWDERRW